MRKTVPMQPADVAAWTEIARIAAEKLQACDPWAPPTTPATMRMKKPDIDDWVEWALKAPINDVFVACSFSPIQQAALLMHERMHAMYGYLCGEVPDECRVVSLMQNEGE